MIESVVIILLCIILMVALLKWLCPMAGIPGNITNILVIIVVVLGIFKLLSALGFGFGF